MNKSGCVRKTIHGNWMCPMMANFLREDEVKFMEKNNRNTTLSKVLLFIAGFVTGVLLLELTGGWPFR